MTADEVTRLIEGAAARHGVPTDALLAIANLESSGNIRADNPRSSASGLFQFVDGTAREYGLTGNRRNDPAAQADAAAKMMAKNAQSLERTLGRPANPGELYLAHQQGLTGATALLSNPNRPAIDVLTGVYGSRAKAESALRLNGGSTRQSAGQFAGQWVNKANERASLIPPGEIPNVVATQTDTRRPQQVTATASTPANNRATLAAPSFAVTPRLAPGNGDIYSFHLPDQTPTSVVGGLGSLTPGRVAPPLPRARPERPAQSYAGQERSPAQVQTASRGFPTPLPGYVSGGPPQRLPELPNSGIATPGTVNASIARANAARDPELAGALANRNASPGMVETSMARVANAVDPGLQRALAAQGTVDTSMQRAMAAVDPALQRALEARNAPGVGLPPGTRVASSVPVPVPTTAIPGPNTFPKGQERLVAGAYPMAPVGLPELPGVGTALDVVPRVAGFPPLPRPRPVQVAMPTPVAMRPMQAAPRMANVPLPRPRPNIAPVGTSPLRIVVSGARVINGGGGNSGGSSSAPSSAPTFSGSSTGSAYTPGQQYVMNGQTYTATSSGSFVNDKTGREVAKGNDWQSRHGLS